MPTSTFQFMQDLCVDFLLMIKNQDSWSPAQSGANLARLLQDRVFTEDFYYEKYNEALEELTVLKRRLDEFFTESKVLRLNDDYRQKWSDSQNELRKIRSEFLNSEEKYKSAVERISELEIQLAQATEETNEFITAFIELSNNQMNQSDKWNERCTDLQRQLDDKSALLKKVQVLLKASE